MPAQSGKSKLFASLGSDVAKEFAKHKADETIVPGGSRLPEGIEGGVASLVDMKVDIYKDGDNKGKPYFFARGVVVSPTHAPNGVPVQGSSTTFMEPLCNTPNATGKRKTLGDHVAHVLNLLRLFKVETKDAKDLSQLDAAVQFLMQQKPHFNFRTWKGKMETTGQYANKEPRVNETWLGVCDMPVSEMDPDAGVTEETPSESGSDESSLDEVAGTTDDAGNEDLDAMAELCGTDGPEGEAARAELERRAIAVGKTAQDVNDSSSWDEVVGWIRDGEASAEQAGEETSWTPAKGEVYKYAPINTKTKKPGKAFDCEVTSVDAEKQTVNLKNHDDGKSVYKAIPWAKLVAG